MKNNLTKKLSCYSGVAGSIFFMTTNSNAQIVYTDPPDIILSGFSSADLDLNNDGFKDIQLNIADQASWTDGGVIFIYQLNYHEGIAVNAVSEPCASGESNYMAKALEIGDVINGGTDWADLHDFVALADFDGPYATNCQQWLGKQNRYLGIRIGSVIHFHYGWLRLSVNHQGTKLIIKDWALNLSNNQPINAGQTMRLEDPAENDNHKLEVFSNGTQIFIHHNDSNMKLEVRVYNSIGQQVSYLHTNEAAEALNTESWARGIYIVHVTSPENSFSQKVMVN